MRTVSVFVLLVVTLVACCNDFTGAENAIEATNQHKSINIPVTNAFNRRNLRTANGEERGFNFMDKLPAIFKRNPSLSKQVEKLQSNPAKLQALEKSTFTSKMRAYFKHMSDNSSKTEKAIMAGTIILFIIAMPLVWTYSHW
ncbi:Secreted RxLR effector peptide protein [Phytophthora palmivora]|uniref:RxLR effector protein n=1 Tax=Phytophthora palmivora TaxID=4796 RepID=A0A2P4Y446_9STRA|nr:Secreted RxLR effector peptide protein [Phytophthora palmivora]